MAEGNYLCETGNCVNPATAFGLAGTLKLRSCNQHLLSLLTKQMAIYGIERYEFISTQQDAVLFEERKARVEKGLENLTVQEARLNEEYASAIQLLELEKEQLLKLVEEMFVKNCESVKIQYDKAKLMFTTIMQDFNRYLLRQECELKPEAETLCTEMKHDSWFICLELLDAFDSESQSDSKYCPSLVQDFAFLLQSAASKVSMPTFSETAGKFSKEGANFHNSKKLKEAEFCYLQAEQLYNSREPKSQSAAINLANLGLLLLEMGRWEKAEQRCKAAQALFDNVIPQSLEAADNLLNLGSVCCSLKHFEEAEDYCQRAQWIYDTLQVVNKNAAINLRNFGLVKYEEKQYYMAEQLYQQAQSSFEQVAPQSLDAGKNYNNLALVYFSLQQWQEAEENFLKAQIIYQTEAPQSYLMADCLYNVGVLYEAQGRMDESITALQLAEQLYGVNAKEWKG